jgi:segregation and condensation protein A
MNANNSVLNIKIENFDGPLDMLSELIKEQKMDITQVNLVDIVDQYCEFIEKNSEEIQINSAIEYLQIQANLILIKSK